MGLQDQMKITNNRNCILTLVLLIVFWLPDINRADDQAAFLPVQTVAAFSIVDGQTWAQQWRTTGLAKFFQKSSVQNYLQQVANNSGEAGWLKVILPSDNPVEVEGQFTYALIASPRGFEQLIQLDCSSVEVARNWKDTVAKRLVGEQRMVLTPTTNSTGVLRFKSAEGKGQLGIVTKGKRGYVCTSPELLVNLLANRNGTRLVSRSEFTSTVQRAFKETAQPMFWWFARPLELSQGKPGNNKNANTYQMLKSQGFDAFQAIGGAGKIDAKTNRIKSVGYVSVRQPLKLAARILDFQESRIPVVPAWSNEATFCGFANIDTARFLEYYSTMFDAMYGEGETGIFDAVLDDLKNRTDGPQIDLQRELFAFLKPQVFFATVPNETSSAVAIAIPVQAPDRIAGAVRKLFQGDSRAKNQSGPDHSTWTVMPLEDGYGIRQPFVISIRDNWLFIVPDAIVLNRIARRTSNREATFGTGAGTAKFACKVDMANIAARLLNQLKNKNISDSTRSLLGRLELEQAVLQADTSDLPDFNSVSNFFETNLHIAIGGAGKDWGIQIESK